MPNYHTTNDEKRMLRLMLTAQVMTLQAELDAIMGNRTAPPTPSQHLAKQVAIDELNGKIRNLTAYLDNEERPGYPMKYKAQVHRVGKTNLYHWLVMPAPLPSGEYEIPQTDHGWSRDKDLAWEYARQRERELNGIC